MRFRRPVRGVLLVAALLTTTVLGSVPVRADDAVASDFVLPKWQGKKLSAAAAGHWVDCRITTSTPRTDGNCDVNIQTVTDGHNCYLEDSSDSVSSLNPGPRRGTSCTALIKGTAHWVASPAACSLEPSLSLSFSSGVNSSLYEFEDIPIGATFVPLYRAASGLDYALDVYDIGATTLVHTPQIHEHLIVHFNVAMPASCPTRDTPSLVANVYDPAPDLVVSENEGSAGFLVDNVCPNCNIV